MKFGDLTWEAEPLGKEINFLDLTISLQANGHTLTKTFVKPMNLHLYIPPESAHPLGVLKALSLETSTDTGFRIAEQTTMSQ